MKIKTDSWHYQLMKNLGMSVYSRTNLCSYIRGLLMALLTLPMTILSPLILYLVMPLKLVTITSWQAIILFLLIVWGVVGAGIIVLIVAGSIVYLICGVIDVVNLPTIHLPKNNIVIQYIKAKKQKICPIIEFE